MSKDIEIVLSLEKLRELLRGETIEYLPTAWFEYRDNDDPAIKISLEDVSPDAMSEVLDAAIDQVLAMARQQREGWDNRTSAPKDVKITVSGHIDDADRLATDVADLAGMMQTAERVLDEPVLREMRKQMQNIEDAKDRVERRKWREQEYDRRVEEGKERTRRRDPDVL